MRGYRYRAHIWSRRKQDALERKFVAKILRGNAKHVKVKEQ